MRRAGIATKRSVKFPVDQDINPTAALMVRAQGTVMGMVPATMDLGTPMGRTTVMIRAAIDRDTTATIEAGEPGEIRTPFLFGSGGSEHPSQLVRGERTVRIQPELDHFKPAN